MTNHRSTPIDQIRAMRHRLAAERLDQSRYDPDDTQETQLPKTRGPGRARAGLGLLAVAAVGVTAALAVPAAATSESGAAAETTSSSSSLESDDGTDAINGEGDDAALADPEDRGPSVDRPTPDSPETGDAPAAPGPKADRHAHAEPDPTADGSLPDGPKPDGPKPDGPKPDGPKAEGPKAEGPKADGPRPRKGHKGKVAPGVHGPRGDHSGLPAPPVPPRSR